jgi:hypothetical protein
MMAVTGYEGGYRLEVTDDTGNHVYEVDKMRETDKPCHDRVTDETWL